MSDMSVVNANEKRPDDTTFCAELTSIFAALASHLIAERENSAKDSAFQRD
jgi:hypothetical protein